MANGSSIGAGLYTSSSTWTVSVKGSGGADALASSGTVATPCDNADCAAKTGTLSAQQKVAANALEVPAKAKIKVDGAADGWCIASLCISSGNSGAKAYKWTGNKWMNPGSAEPDAGTASSEWSLDLTEVDSCTGEEQELGATKDEKPDEISSDIDSLNSLNKDLESTGVYSDKVEPLEDDTVEDAVFDDISKF